MCDIEASEILNVLSPIWFDKEETARATGGSLSDMTFTKLLSDMGYLGKVTAHGFRSSFKVWTVESAKIRDEVSEAVLAHKIPEEVRAAYLRTQFFDERRPLMANWARHVCQPR